MHRIPSPLHARDGSAGPKRRHRLVRAVLAAAPLTLLLAMGTATAASASVVSSLSVHVLPPSPGTSASYDITFTPATSLTLLNTVTVQAAPGTTFSACSSCSGSYEIVQGTQSQSIGNVSVQAVGGSSTTNELVATLGLDLIYGGTPVTLIVPATNPAAGGPDTLTVSTSGDTTPVSAGYTIGSPAGSLLQGAYENASNSPGFLQTLFGTPTGTAPTFGSEYGPSATWSEIDGVGSYGPTGSSSLAYLQSTEDWSTSGQPPQPTPGYQFQLAVAMFPSNACTPACTLASGADLTSFNADYKAYWAQLAQTLVNLGLGDTYLRLGWEFDHNDAGQQGAQSEAWSIGGPAQAAIQQNATDFAQYWRNIVTTMRTAQPTAQFKFVWNPDSQAFLGAGDPEYATCGCSPDLQYAFPGSGYVDDIGLDAYDQTGWNSTYTNFDNTIQVELADAESFAADNGDIPLAFPEWGVCAKYVGADSTCQGDDPAFIDGMHAFMTTPADHVAYENYFNVSTASLHNSQITGGGFPNSLQRFIADFG